MNPSDSSQTNDISFKKETYVPTEMKVNTFLPEDSLTNLRELVQEQCFITEPTASKVITNLDDLMPFQSRNIGEDHYVCLPSNIADLVKNNYLIKLYFKACEMRKSKYIQSNKEFVSTLELTPIMGALHGFGTVMLGKVKYYDKNLKGQFKAGLYCGLKSLVGFLPDVDLRMFKFSKANTPAEILIGSAWGNKFPTEKAMLDSIIYAVHRKEPDYDVLSSYLLKYEEIAKLYGINVNRHVNKLISNEEQKFIEATYDEFLKETVNIKFDNYHALIAVQKDFLKLSKKLRKYKEVCDTLIDNRIKVVYSKLSKQQKKKKQPIEQLIQPLKGTVEYVNFFNPCRAAGLDLTFRIGDYPQNAEYFKSTLAELDKFLKKNSKGVEETRLDYIYNWYSSEMGNNL